VEQDRAGVTSARAQLVKDRANLAYAKASVSRLANLLALHAISRDTYEVAASALDQARAQVALDAAVVDQRIAVLTTAEVNLGYTNILSPVDGTVVSRNVTMGQTVAASFQTPTMFLIATDLSQMQVDTNVAEGDIGDIQIGDKAQFRVEAFPNRTFAGVVTQIRQAPQSVQNVVTYDVIIAVSNPQLLLKPGMTATVRIITERRDHVLRVPDMALRYVPGGLSSASEPVGATSPQLFVLRDGRAHRMAVNIGLDDGSNSEITGGGIREGDLVIVSETASVSTGRSRGNATPDLRFR
jgi:HlyD family secretion protein